MTTVSYITDEIIQAFLSHPGCDYFCLNRRVPVLNLIMVWSVASVYFAVIPTKFKILVASEVIGKSFNFVLLFFLTSDMTKLLHHWRIFTIVICIIVMTLLTVWTLYRLKVLAFVNQYLLVKLSIEHEREIVSSNSIWHLV